MLRPRMLYDVALWAIALVIGIALQRRDDARRLNRAIWNGYFFTLSPAVVLFAYSTIPVGRGLVESLTLVAATSWTVLGLGLALGRLVGRSRQERGAIALCAAWGNTAALGYPLAALAYGQRGLALQALYAQFAFGVPAIAVSTTVARLHGAAREREATASAFDWRRFVLRNPPLVAAAVAIALRVRGVDVHAIVRPVGHVAGVVSGPLGFLQLGLSLPLHRIAHDRGDLTRAAAVLALRHGAAPLMLFGLAAALGVDMPGVFVLAMAAPVAFHLVTLASVFDVRADLVRLLVVVSTIGAVGAIVAGVALSR